MIRVWEKFGNHWRNKIILLHTITYEKKFLIIYLTSHNHSHEIASIPFLFIWSLIVLDFHWEKNRRSRDCFKDILFKFSTKFIGGIWCHFNGIGLGLIHTRHNIAIKRYCDKKTFLDTCFYRTTKVSSLKNIPWFLFCLCALVYLFVKSLPWPIEIHGSKIYFYLNIFLS